MTVLPYFDVRSIVRNLLGVVVVSLGAASAAWAYQQSPTLDALTKSGELPPVEERVPTPPRVVQLAKTNRTVGRYGGDLSLLMGRSKDVRLMVVYGYARLVGFNRLLELVPDILAKVENQQNRVFTLHLRKGHRWSDGHPFTAEDFRYYWEDIANNDKLSPFGPPAVLLSDGKPPKFEVLGEQTVRFTWEQPNPRFLPALAGTRPTYIYAPSHFLKPFHERYGADDSVTQKAKSLGQRNWAALHNRMDSPYKNREISAPTLQPWKLATRPPSQRFVFERNAYYHRVDEKGNQLPYMDRVVMNIADGKLIPAKTGAGETDLQARHIHFSDFTFLKQQEKRSSYNVRLWQTTKGSHLAIFPNMNVTDPGWRKLIRDVRFRRALSLGIDRSEINEVIYQGFAVEGNNTVHEQSPLFEPKYRDLWAEFDPEKANELLDSLGLTARDDDGVRKMADGRPLHIIVETAGEDVEQVDILELIQDSWKGLGIKLFTKPLQREVFRNRIFSGESMFSVWGGLENGVPTAGSAPDELAATSQQQLQWPKWGQYVQDKGKAGERPDDAGVRRLNELYEQWENALDVETQARIWKQMLDIHAQNTYTIGIIAAVPQPVVIGNGLKNVPNKGIYNWEPGAHFGIYQPDTFWKSR